MEKDIIDLSLTQDLFPFSGRIEWYHHSAYLGSDSRFQSTNIDGPENCMRNSDNTAHRNSLRLYTAMIIQKRKNIGAYAL